VGYEAIEEVLLGKMVLSTMALLILVKILATSLTIGSGGSGGVFAPALFIGAMVGGTFGTVVHQLLPDITASSGAYALVGMAAVFAGAAHAPITSVIILFEMTNDYRIILPLMLATVVSTLLVQKLFRENIYTLKLARRGIRLEQGHDVDVMQSVLVGEAMATDIQTVDTDLPLAELDRIFYETHHHGIPALDSEGNLFGIVTLQDLERAKERGPLDGWLVRDIATRSLLVTYPDEPVWTALKRLGIRDVGRLPVVERQNPKRLVGVIRRHDIIRAYNIALSDWAKSQHRQKQLKLRDVDNTEFIELKLQSDATCVNRTVSDIATSLPHEVIIISIRRASGEVIIPHGDTSFQAGDQVVAFIHTDSKPALFKCLQGSEQPLAMNECSSSDED
jgi:CIC family chloride channel protein